MSLLLSIDPLRLPSAPELFDVTVVTGRSVVEPVVVKLCHCVDHVPLDEVARVVEVLTHVRQQSARRLSEYV